VSNYKQTIDIQTYYPENPILKEYIEYYYFLKTDSPDFLSRYYVFPNTLQAFNIHRFASCNISPHFIEVLGDKTNQYLMVAQGKFEVPLVVQLKGVLDKVTIIFKPLGLNHFINHPYIRILSESSQVFTDWYDDENCEGFLNSFYQTENNKARVNILEAYLLSQFKPFEEAALLQRALNMLTDFDNEYPIEQIIQRIGMNTRTFNRLFYKCLGISPIGFRKIARFRHSLQNKLFSDQFKKLTEIGYESNFHDQSYFIKMYKKITGNNPSQFFNSIDKLADDKLIFQFIQT
jgi:AraC-like DNA-binding protein